MTRIYFKPQGCCVRSPRSSREHRWSKLAPERMKKGEHGSNWRKQLDPEAIEQIADGLEKMVLSWTSPTATTSQRLPCSPTTHVHPDQANLLLAPLALEDMMRGELIKTCRPSLAYTGDNVLASQQSAEASFWYLTPSNTLPNCNIVSECQVQDTDGETKVEHNLQDVKVSHQSLIATQAGWSPKWPCIQSLDDAKRGSDVTAAKEAACRQIDSCVPDTVSPCCIKVAGSSHLSQNMEVDVGNQVMELLGKTSCVRPGNSLPYMQPMETEESVDVHKKKVEELQIALLECAMEYEVKIVEMKMQMLHFKSEQRQKDGESSCSPKLLPPTSSCSQEEKTDGQRVEYLRKQLFRLQRENLALSRELNDLKKRERQFDLQRRSLDDALGRVNALQRELGKRDQEIVNCRLREKEVRAQVYEVQLALHKAQAARIEPRKLLSLLPALREWLQTIKRVPLELTVTEEPREKSSNLSTPPVDSIVCSVTKEIQALQKALSKLAAKK